MKKIICVIIAAIIVVSSFFVCLYAYTLNYDYQKESVSFQDAISGYPKKNTTIDRYETDYYALLDSCTYTCLDFFEATSVIFSSNNVQSIAFTSSKLFDSEKYNTIFAMAEVIIRDDGAYVFVTHKPEGRLAHSLYRIDNDDFIEQINMDDFENEDVASDIVHSCFSSCILFMKQYGIAFAIIFTVILICLLLISKQKKFLKK